MESGHGLPSRQLFFLDWTWVNSCQSFQGARNRYEGRLQKKLSLQFLYEVVIGTLLKPLSDDAVKNLWLVLNDLDAE